MDDFKLYRVVSFIPSGRYHCFAVRSMTFDYICIGKEHQCSSELAASNNCYLTSLDVSNYCASIVNLITTGDTPDAYRLVDLHVPLGLSAYPTPMHVIYTVLGPTLG